MRVEIHRIAGDVYINGAKVIFAVDFRTDASYAEFSNTDWLIGWAKIGLMSHGHDVPHSEIRSIVEHERLAAMPKPEEFNQETSIK